MRRIPLPVAALILVALAGCGDEMEDQPKLEAYEAAEAFPDQAAARPLPEGVVARGALARRAAARNPPPVTPDLVARGRQRFDVFCAPCHGRDGYGDGMIVQRGFPSPPSYHSERLRSAPARHFYEVITNGYGVMYAYADRVPPTDRWAIVAYIRALQLSQRARLDEVPGAAEALP